MGTPIDFAAAVARLRGERPPAGVADLPDSYPPTMGELCPNWLDDRRTDGYRPRGIASYRDIFLRFVAYVGEIPPASVTSDDVKNYRRYQMGRGVGAATTRHSLTVIRAFFAWAVDEGYCKVNPAQGVKNPIVQPPDPDPLTSDEIQTLLDILDALPKSHRYTWRRNRRAVYLMLYAGLRIAETAGLEWRDIDLKRRTITVRGEIAKGGKPRTVPICDELARELEAATHKVGAVVDQGDKAGRGKPLGVKSLAHIFERYIRRRGLHIHAHQLRKTFATELYQRGENLITIQRLLGHSDPKTTMRYIGISAETEHAAVARLVFRGVA